jgi:sodium/hydrogen antiporter
MLTCSAVATIVGIIFGPVALNLFNPFTWGNTDQITLELSRIVLVVQVFAVGVELPKAYMWRHWRSLFLLLVPVMTFGWVVSSAFIYWLIPAFNFVFTISMPV